MELLQIECNEALLNHKAVKLLKKILQFHILPTFKSCYLRTTVAYVVPAWRF